MPRADRNHVPDRAVETLMPLDRRAYDADNQDLDGFSEAGVSLMMRESALAVSQP